MAEPNPRLFVCKTSKGSLSQPWHKPRPQSKQQKQNQKREKERRKQQNSIWPNERSGQEVQCTHPVFAKEKAVRRKIRRVRDVSWKWSRPSDQWFDQQLRASWSRRLCQKFNSATDITHGTALVDIKEFCRNWSSQQTVQVQPKVVKILCVHLIGGNWDN